MPFDLAACVLALMNIDPLEPVVRGVAQCLAPGGRFVMVILHPAFRSPGLTSWGWEEQEAKRGGRRGYRQYRRAQRRLVVRQRLRNAVTHRAGLSGGATTGDVHQHIEFRAGVGQLQRLADNHPQRFVFEIVVNLFVIDLEIACSRPQVNSRGRTFPAACSVILNISHDAIRSWG